jgi:hypothetical protein
VRLSNGAARRLVECIPDEVRGVPTNLFRVALHPAGLAGRTLNFASWSAHLLRQLHRLTPGNDELAALAAEIATWPAIPPRSTWGQAAPDDEPDPVMTWQIRLDGRDYSMYSVMSAFGTPADITLSELTIELFFPANQATQDYLRVWPETSGKAFLLD